MKNSKGTPAKETGAKNNDSNNDVDFKNSTKADNRSSSTSSNKSTTRGSKQ